MNELYTKSRQINLNHMNELYLTNNLLLLCCWCRGNKVKHDVLVITFRTMQLMQQWTRHITHLVDCSDKFGLTLSLIQCTKCAWEHGDHWYKFEMINFIIKVSRRKMCFRILLFGNQL